jgi:hypothetical protein
MKVKYSCERPEANLVVPPSPFSIMGQEKIKVDNDGIIWWHIHNFCEDIEPHHQIGVFHSSYTDWERHLFPWEFRSTSDPTKAAIHIYSAKQNKIHLPNGDIMDSPYDFIKAPDVLAVQWAEYSGFAQSGWMVINDDHKFGLKNTSYIFEFMRVVRHESGHYLRLGHTNKKGDLMYPVYSPNDAITQDSIDGIYHAHGDHIKEYVKKLERARAFIRLYGEKAESDCLKNNKGCMLPWFNHYNSQ